MPFLHHAKGHPQTVTVCMWATRGTRTPSKKTHTHMMIRYTHKLISGWNLVEAKWMCCFRIEYERFQVISRQFSSKVTLIWYFSVIGFEFTSKSLYLPRKHYITVPWRKSGSEYMLGVICSTSSSKCVGFRKSFVMKFSMWIKVLTRFQMWPFENQSHSALSQWEKKTQTFIIDLICFIRTIDVSSVLFLIDSWL